MRHRHVARALALASVITSGLGFSSPAYAGDPAAAREQVKLGYQLAQDGKCEEAIPHFVESLKLDAKAITLINLASCEEKTAHLADALGHWVEARARAQAEGNAGIEEEAEKRAKALEPRLPKLTVVVEGAPADAEVTRDGVALGTASMGVPLPVNPGAHVLVVRAKGHEDTTQSVSLGEGETKRVELKLGAPRKEIVAAPIAKPRAPDNEPGGISPLVFIGFGTALVGIGVGTVTGIMAFGKASTAKDACPNNACTPAGLDAVDSGRTLGTISTIGFIVGGVGAGVGVYGLLFGQPKASTSVAVSLGPTGGGLRGTF
jgi:PEGA domain